MRANGKSSYQIKKEKLQRIKTIIKEIKKESTLTGWYEENLENEDSLLSKIWELVKDE